MSTQNGGNDVWVLPLEGDRKPVLLLGTQFLETLGVFSPDGRWIAYVSNESGRNEVYVRPFVARAFRSAGLGRREMANLQKRRNRAALARGRRGDFL